MEVSQKSNHLATASSPYLKQHVHNPVDWYPWGEEALQKALNEDKPILLSIGYAACHWCHVMAHESFEDEETAKLMNQYFVNIKVDREERPDLDKIYQTAHYLLTQQAGGWPLTVFLAPDDLVPFFSGTYFPREARYHLPAFKEVLQAIAEAYKHRRTQVKDQNKELLAILQHQGQPHVAVQLTHQPIQQAQQLFTAQYDKVNGGFNGAPKFPQAPKLSFLLAIHSPIVADTLQHIAQGGINDQIGGGFFRYAVDDKWLIPHFEKMLYDNAQLLFLYTSASNIFAEPAFADAARQIGMWIINHMQSPEGGYYSSFDADSEGHEGKYYVWTPEEVKTLLTDAEFNLVSLYFGLNQPANFENKWHLHVAQSLQEVAPQLKISLEEAKQLLQSAKETLLFARLKRIPPARDDKILTAWNGLMIKAMLSAGKILNESIFIESAQRALNFILNKMSVNQRLFATYNDGTAHLSAYLDDYIFLIDALLTSLQITWNTNHLIFAMELADTVLVHFTDENGGFFFTADDHEKLLYRPKTMMDEAIPAANGVAVSVFLKLGYLLGETRYLDAAEKTLQSAWRMLSQYPTEHASLLSSLKEFLNPDQIIVIRGNKNELKSWQDACQTITNQVYAIPENESLPGLLAEKKFAGNTCAYVCQGMHCLPVITDLETLQKQSKSN